MSRKTEAAVRRLRKHCQNLQDKIARLEKLMADMGFAGFYKNGHAAKLFEAETTLNLLESTLREINEDRDGEADLIEAFSRALGQVAGFLYGVCEGDGWRHEREGYMTFHDIIKSELIHLE